MPVPVLILHCLSDSNIHRSFLVTALIRLNSNQIQVHFVVTHCERNGAKQNANKPFRTSPNGFKPFFFNSTQIVSQHKTSLNRHPSERWLSITTTCVLVCTCSIGGTIMPVTSMFRTGSKHLHISMLPALVKIFRPDWAKTAETEK
jgi:hypothetical protein